MSPISREALLLQFKTTNYIGLAMIASVFVYAGLVFAISHGYIHVKLRPALSADLAAKIKYALLVAAGCHYLIIKFFQRIASKEAGRLPAAAIIVFALSEAVAVYGLLVFFLTGVDTNFFIFMAISLFYFFLFYPKFADWERVLQQKPQANSSST